MRSDRPLSFRLVVQCVRENSHPRQYRLIAYGDAGTCQPLQFASLRDVRERVRRALPELDTTRISEPADSAESSILFAEVLDLTPLQLGLLGLEVDSKSR